MIKLVRVDHRLLHGQVAMSWTQSIGTDCILIANDSVVDDDIRKTTLKIAKPYGCKLVFKTIKDSIEAINSGKTDKYNLFIIVDSVKDVVKLARKVNAIKSINLGGIKFKEGATVFSNAISLMPEEIEELSQLILDQEIEIEIRQIPTDKKIFIKEIFSK